MTGVLVREDGFVHRDLPVNQKRGVQNGDAAIRLGVVELVALVLEHCCVAENDETVCKAFGNKELPVVFIAELDSDVLPVGRRALAYVYGNVQDTSAYTADNLALCIWRTLEVEAAHDTVAGHRLVVLNEYDGMSVLGYSDLFVKFPLGEAFKEISSRISEYPWFENHGAVYMCLDYFHVILQMSYASSPAP